MKDIFDQDWSDLLKDDLEKLVELSAPVHAENAEQKLKLDPGERRYVSVLFLDMKGFTALSEKFDHEIINHLIDKLFTIFKQHIDRRDGWVEKFEGDAILAAFGSHKAHEDDAARAVDAALAIVDSWEKLNPMMQKQGIVTGIRIGINSGEVTKSKRAEFDVITGDTVNVAARLEQNAVPGTVLISSVTQALASDRYTYQQQQPLTVKGKTEPILTFQVTGRRHRLGRWKRSSLISRIMFSGRKNELQKLVEIYQEWVLHPAAQIPETEPIQHVLIGVRGEAGIGKSRLIHEFLRKILPEKSIDKDDQDRGRMPGVLKGSAVPFAPGPYELVLSMLKDLLGISITGEPARYSLECFYDTLTKQPGADPSLKQSLPIIGFLLGVRYPDDRLKTHDPHLLKTEILIALRDLIQALAVHIYCEYHRPLLLIWEDFHWVDSASLEAMTFLITTSRTTLPMLILVPYRLDGELPEISNRRIKRHIMELAPLSLSDEITIIQSMLDDIDIPEPFQEMIHERSQGNPFFIEEMVLHFIETGVVTRNHGSWLITPGYEKTAIPLSLKTLVNARIDYIKNEHKTILQHSSVIGREFAYAILKSIESRIEGGSDPKEQLETLEALSFIISTHHTNTQPVSFIDPINGSQTCDELGVTYGFKSLLIHEVVYGSLLHSNRKILHRLCGEAIETLYSNNLEPFYGLLGEHWQAGDDPSKAATYFILAGNRAYDICDYSNAINNYTSALGLIGPSDSRRIDILLKRGELAQRLGHMKDAETDTLAALELSEMIADLFGKANALRNIGNLNFQNNRMEEAASYYERALTLMITLKNRKGEAGIIHNLGNIELSKGDHNKALDTYHRALEIREETGDRHGQADTLNCIGTVLCRLGDFQKAYSFFSKSLIIRTEVGDRSGEIKTLNNIGNIHVIQGDLDTAIEFFQRLACRCREIGNILDEAKALNNIGVIHLNHGEFESARHAFTTFLNIQKELANQKGISVAYHNLGMVMYHMGRFTESSAYLTNSIHLKEDLGDSIGISESLNTLGILTYECGCFTEAEHYYLNSLEIRQRVGDKKGESDNMVNLGKIEFARCRFAKSREWYEHALRLKEKIGDKFGKAYILNNLGDICFAQNDDATAMIHYTEAHSLFETLGDLRGQSVCIMNRGKVFRNQGQYDQAFKQVQESLRIREKIGNLRGIAFAHHVLGDIYFSLKKMENARLHHEKSLAIKEQINDHQGIGFSMQALGLLHYYAGDYPKASDYFNKALNCSQETEQENMTALNRSLLARSLWQQNHDHPVAEKLSSEAIQWLDRMDPDRNMPCLNHEHILFTHFLIHHSHENALAKGYLRKSHAQLLIRIGQITDPTARQTIQSHPMNAEIDHAWSVHNDSSHPGSDNPG